MERRIATLTLLSLVLSGVGAILVTIPQVLYEVARGKNVTLPCSIKFQGTGTPKQVIVTWSAVADTPGTQEDAVLTYYSTEQITDIGTLYEGRVSLDVDAATANANLKLSSTTLNDNRVFKCHALIPSDVKGTPTATTRLVVLVAPTTPICTIQGKAEYGQNINLTCLSAEGSPPPTYTWQSLDAMNKPRDLPPRATAQGGILSLYNISKDTSGFFICTSKNKIGSASYNLTLAVMPPSMNIASTAGIIGGVIAALIVLIIVIYCCCCRKKKKDEEYAMGVREEEEEEERETFKEPVRNGVSPRADGQEDARGSDSSVRNPVELSERDYKNRKDLDAATTTTAAATTTTAAATTTTAAAITTTAAATMMTAVKGTVTAMSATMTIAATMTAETVVLMMTTAMMIAIVTDQLCQPISHRGGTTTTKASNLYRPSSVFSIDFTPMAAR
ncbi:hypothetical protein PFLUV_G00030430 [Perca fluviatilis]|uniref:Ig-like domain-containing protein n=1 Tax=Perca fluviatilis TaxID=8168 RepID=A0A6A5FBM0_PERFL|nr:hypothetical protein PFLUV_G00030430 [Perca fluviatilis]